MRGPSHFGQSVTTTEFAAEDDAAKTQPFFQRYPKTTSHQVSVKGGKLGFVELGGGVGFGRGETTAGGDCDFEPVGSPGRWETAIHRLLCALQLILVNCWGALDADRCLDLDSFVGYA